MKRSGFRKPQIERRRSIPTPGTGRGVHAPSPDVPVVVEKREYVRSEAYRRLVASLPCTECGVHGYSQAAHADHGGKGMSLKTCDLTCYPLCGPRPGIAGCHHDIGHGAKYHKAARRAMEHMASGETIYALREAARSDKKIYKVLHDVGLLP